MNDAISLQKQILRTNGQIVALTKVTCYMLMLLKTIPTDRNIEEDILKLYEKTDFLVRGDNLHPPTEDEFRFIQEGIDMVFNNIKDQMSI